MTTPNYNCSQAALYQIGRNVLDALSENLPTFTAFRAKYDNNYISTSQLEITAAEALPDFQARSAQTEVDYNNLCKQLDVCTAQWQLLKRYIHTAFVIEDQKTRLDEAGAGYYSKAISRNWDAAFALLMSGNNFINIHEATLSANNEMPAIFKDQFKTEQDKFMQQLTEYQKSEKKIKINTQEKINANNNIYKRITQICLDGQQLYKNNPALKDQFTFTSLLALVSGIGATGFKGYIYDLNTNNNISDVVISCPQFSKTYKSDENGYFEISRIASGVYTISFTCQGYNIYTLENYEISSGIVRNLNIKLVPAS